MVEHIVLIKLLPNVSTEQKDELIRRTILLKDIIPGIIDIQQGINFSNRNKGYDIGLTVRFEDRTSLENYGPHPAHQEIFAYLKEIGLEDIIIVDFDINTFSKGCTQ
ncbi:Dabb family protein [Neobacillus drentensis]|uniref:Dabb family protein n=1 Tax=Neobacillus drentensis TaxID=220684 RepID=UPI003002BDC0